MLKKLFVHEWKDCWKLVSLMNLIVVLLTLIGVVPLSQQDFLKSSNIIVTVGIVLYVTIYIIALIALSFFVSLFFFIRFYKNMYTDEGYLMHTLPVTKAQLVWSKALVAIIWHLITVFILSLSVLSLVYAGIVGSGETIDFAQISSELGLGYISTWSYVALITVYVFSIVVGSFMSVFMGYLSVSIGQLFQKQKVIAAIGVYFGFNFLIQIISNIISAILNYSMGNGTLYGQNFNSAEDFFGYTFMIMGIMDLAILVLAGAFYFFTIYIMKNKLNLD